MHTAEMGEIAYEVQLVSHDAKSRILQEAKTLIKQTSLKNGINWKKKKKPIFIGGSEKIIKPQNTFEIMHAKTLSCV